jgi:hypothetical protein
MATPDPPVWVDLAVGRFSPGSPRPLSADCVEKLGGADHRRHSWKHRHLNTAEKAIG